MDNTALYGSTATSDTYDEGNTEKILIKRPEYAARNFGISSVPKPEPVPPSMD
jgi:hypothetical protein